MVYIVLILIPSAFFEIFFYDNIEKISVLLPCPKPLLAVNSSEMLLPIMSSDIVYYISTTLENKYKL